MMRPTVAEILAGIQRTILTAMLPELTSPYAQGQAMMAALQLARVAESLERAPAYDAAEAADLAETFTSLSALAGKLPAELRAAVERATDAAKASPLDRRAMEASMAELAAALAIGMLE